MLIVERWFLGFNYLILLQLMFHQLYIEPTSRPYNTCFARFHLFSSCEVNTLNLNFDEKPWRADLSNT